MDNSLIVSLKSDIKDSKCFWKSHNKVMNYCAIILIETLFVLYKIFSISLIAYLASLFLFLCIVFSKKHQLLLIIFAFLPCNLMMKISNSGGAILGYCIFFAELKFLVFNKSRPIISWALILLCFSVLVTSVFYYDFSLVIRFIRFLVSAIFLCSLVRDTDLLAFIGRHGADYYIFGVLLNVLFGLVIYIVKGMPLFAGNFSGVSTDRNYFSTTVSIAISFCILFFFTDKKVLARLCELIFLLFGGLLSGSRTFFISLLIPAFLFFYCFFKTKDFRRILITIFALIIGSTFILIFMRSSIDNILGRIDSSDFASANGRIDAWKYYLNYTFRSTFTILFGCSSKLNPYVIPITWYGTGGQMIVQHNTFIQALSEIGFVGLVLLLWFFVDIFKSINSTYKNHLIYLSPLASLLLCYCFINGLFGDMITFLVFLCFVFFKNFAGIQSKGIKNENCAN